MIVTIIEIARHLCVCLLVAEEVKTRSSHEHSAPLPFVGGAHSGRTLQWVPAAIDDVRKVNGILFTARIKSKGVRAQGLISLSSQASANRYRTALPLESDP